jgi:hypothetical protein
MSVFEGKVEDPSTHPKFDLTINVSLFSPRKLLAAMGRAYLYQYLIFPGTDSQKGNQGQWRKR